MADPTEKLALWPAAEGAACPAAEALSAFCSGSLGEGELATIAEHLSRCDTCEQTVRELTSAGDVLSSRLRAAVQQAQPIDEPALLRMQSAVKSLLSDRQESVTYETALDAESAASGLFLQPVAHRRSAATATELWSPMQPATIERYAILSELGRGGFGTVYLARDPDLDRLVAIKVPKFAAGVTDEKIQWFLAEARTAARLKHPGIVGIYEVRPSSDGSCYIVMEYVEGHSLSQEMAQGKLPSERAVKIVASAAAAVHYAHKKGLVHRDLKPGNILLDAEGQVKIADFGLAIHEDQQRGRAGERAGTLAYMSPEQVRGEVHRLDGRADVWSLGVILYELLTGRRPFAGTPRELADEILHRPPKPPRQIDDAIPARLEQVVLKCLAKEAEGRHSSAGDLAEELAEFDRTAGRRPFPSRRLQVAVAATLLIGCLLAAFVVPLVRSRTHPYQVDNVARLLEPLELMDAAPEELFADADPESRIFYDPKRRRITMESPGMNIVSLGETNSTWYKLRVFISKPAAGGEAGIFLGYQPLPPLEGKRRWKCHTICIDTTNERQFAIVRSSYEVRENSVGSFSLPGRDLVKAAVPVTAVLDNAMLEVTVRVNRVTEVSWKGIVLPQLADAANAGGRMPPECTGRFGIVNSRGSCSVSGGQFVLLRELP